MASSDEEGETVPHNVSEYEFIVGKDEAISFAELPVEWDGGSSSDPTGKLQKIFLRGKTDDGLRTLYKQVIAWKFDLSSKKPEISVKTKDGYWIKLLKPRKAFENIIQTILVTVHFLHFVKCNPLKSRKALWDNLTKSLSTLETRPSEDDLVDHISLINEAVKRDGNLKKSEILATFLEEKPKKRKASNEEIKRPFIVDDNTDDEQEADMTDKSEDDDDRDDCFDSVCAICDNGGNIVLCEGKCMRSFHATEEDGEESGCVSLGFTKEEYEAIQNVAFYCKNCQYKQHQCFACGELGSSDELSGPEVFQCVNGACGHFYHPECVAKLLHPGDKPAADEHRRKIASGEQFLCPVHKCLGCEGIEARTIHELQFAICRRCPRSYHRQCLPRDIAFEEDVQEGRAEVQRAWELLIPYRILIYCSKHVIDKRILTPVRNHIKFPGPQKQKRNLSLVSGKKALLNERASSSEDTAEKRIPAKPSKGVEKLSPSAKKCELSKKRLKNLPLQASSKKQKVSLNRNSVGKANISSRTNSAEDSELGNKLYSLFYTNDPELVEYDSEKRVGDGPEKTQEVKPTTNRTNKSLMHDAESRKRIVDLMENASSSITIEDIKKRYEAPLTHAQNAKFSADNITLGKVEGAVEAVRAAARKLDEGGSVEDAKAVCESDLLALVMKRWRDKLKVYLAPFLHGVRYTSFGRHFTKVDKLREVVDVLHWYVQDNDMIVDFCCGSNDFSCLMKEKLDEVGKKCLFKNFDIVQPKNDFNFEKRDWMTVQPHELPEGSRLIMGLNPPFGVYGALANRFIDKALEFKPKLLILIVPKETQRLDEKKLRYKLIWEDDQMCSGKSFYLPGSIDVNDKQIEDWNNSPPIVSLWSKPEWAQKHMAITEQYSHLFRAPRNHRSDETQRAVAQISNSSSSTCTRNESWVNQVEDGKSDEKEKREDKSEATRIQKEKKDYEHRLTRSPKEKREEESAATRIQKEKREVELCATRSQKDDFPCDNNGNNRKDKSRDVVKGSSKSNSKQLDGKWKKKMGSNNNNNNIFTKDKSPRKPAPHHPSPNVSEFTELEANASKQLVRASSHLHPAMDDHHLVDHGNFSAHHPYHQSSYDQDRPDDMLMRFRDSRPASATESYRPFPSNRTESFRSRNEPFTPSLPEPYPSFERFPPSITESHLSLNEPFPRMSGGLVYPPVGSPDYGHRAPADDWHMRGGSSHVGLNPSAGTHYGSTVTSATQRYASGLNDFSPNVGGLDGFPGPPANSSGGFYSTSLSRPSRLGYAPGHIPYPHHNNNGGGGWIND